MRENMHKSMILNKCREFHNNNLETYSNPDSLKPSGKRTPPFLLTFEIFNKNIHNCMIESGSSSNVMSLYVCKKLNASCEPYPTQIVQLDISRVRMVGELNNDLLTLFVEPRIHQTIDIHEAYGMLLRRDWS